jgi:polygalacturonase
MPTENVLVKGCTVYHAHGGFVIGSEMSGGAKNLFVTDCNFLGTDIGLRFKTTRGRGGIVEKIYVKNISMKDIVGEAILFDMYYAAVDPIVLAGEKRTAPKVELLPVTEATPRFRDFYINNITCLGAEKAIFIRGLPEMNIHNIQLRNITITAQKGIEITEGKDISLKNIKVITRSDDALVQINNAGNLRFDGLKYKSNKSLFSIAGGRSKNIRLLNTKAASGASSFDDGASSSSLITE